MCAKKSGATTASGGAKKTAEKKKTESKSSVRVFAERPTRGETLAEVKKFFELLKRSDVEAAGAMVLHASKDWSPHQICSLWQDLVGPWLEEQDRDWDVDDDESWRDLGWLKLIDVDLETRWDGSDDSFFVNVIYDGVVTDVSADFQLVQVKGGWSLRREIIHIA
jgi:hypothetical protein